MDYEGKCPHSRSWDALGGSHHRIFPSVTRGMVFRVSHLWPRPAGAFGKAAKGGRGGS